MLHSKYYILHSRKGFTLLELLIFSAIFSIIMVSFITILVTVTSVQSRQASVAEVNQQSQFLLQEIQYYVERSSVIEISQDTPTSSLKLRMPSAAEDPTYIMLSGGTVYIRQTDAGAQQPLTSGKVTVSNISFTKRSNAPSHDSLSVAFTVEYNTANLKQQFAQSLQTAISRVSAATFDSNVVPSSTATYNLGVTGQVWSSVNNVINFSGSNVGIGVSPTQVFQVSGGDIYVSGAGQGIIFKSVGGTCFKLTITNGGLLATSTFTCT